MNGPALDARGSEVVIAWFTMGADDRPRVLCAWSTDGGRTMTDPIEIDGDDAIGRCAIAFLHDGTAAVFWYDGDTAGEHAWLRVRRVHKDGGLDEALTIAEVAPSRRSGFPTAATDAAGVVHVAWTDVSGDGVALAALRLGVDEQ